MERMRWFFRVPDRIQRENGDLIKKKNEKNRVARRIERNKTERLEKQGRVDSIDLHYSFRPSWMRDEEPQFIIIIAIHLWNKIDIHRAHDSI